MATFWLSWPSSSEREVVVEFPEGEEVEFYDDGRIAYTGELARVCKAFARRHGLNAEAAGLWLLQHALVLELAKNPAPLTDSDLHTEALGLGRALAGIAPLPEGIPLDPWHRLVWYSVHAIQDSGGPVTVAAVAKLTACEELGAAHPVPMLSEMVDAAFPYSGNA